MEILFGIGLLSAVLTGVIAERKGRAPLKWAVFGFFVPVISLIVALIVDDYVPPRQRYGPRPEPYSPLDPVDPSDTEDRRAA